MHPIASGVEPCDEPTQLSAEEQREVDRRCRELDRAQGVAWVRGQTYIITGD